MHNSFREIFLIVENFYEQINTINLMFLLNLVLYVRAEI